MNLKEIICTNLLYLRKKHNLTLEQLAEVLSVTRQGYSNYEIGSRDISVEYLKKLADFYGVTLDAIASTTLIEGTQPIIRFNSLFLNEKTDNLEFYNESLLIENINSNLIVVKLSPFIIKVFMTTFVNVENHEMLFIYNNIYYIGTIFYKENGNIIIVVNGKPTIINKTQSRKLTIVGTLLANVDKEILTENFF